MAFDQQKLLEMLAAMRGQVEGERVPAAQAPMPPVQETMNEMAPPQPEYKPQSMPYSMNPYTNLPADKEGMDQGLREQYLSGQQNLLKDLLKQRAMIGAMQARPIQADSTPTIAGWFKLGSNPESSLNKQILDSARPESYEDNQKRLQEALKTSMAGQNTMTDNDLQMLKMKLEADQAKNRGQDLTKLQYATDARNTEYLRKDLLALDKEFQAKQSSYKQILGMLTPDKDGKISVANLTQILPSFIRNIGEEKGALAEGDVKRAYLDTLEQKLQKYLAFVSSDPEGAKVDIEQAKSILDGVKQSEKVLREISREKLKQVDITYGEPDSIYANMYYNRGGKKMKEAVEKKYGLDKDFSEDMVGPHGPSVVQNGVTFKWNPEKKQYE